MTAGRTLVHVLAVVVADRSQEITREHWDRETLTTLWRGTALRLVRR